MTRPSTTETGSPSADLELVLRARSGDAEARSALVERLGCIPKMVRAIARRRFRMEPEDLEDLSQDTALKVLEKLETYSGHSTLEAWIHRFCYLEALNRARDLGRRAAVTTARPHLEPATSDPPMDDPLLEELLERMNPRESEVIRLHFFEDLTFQRIARELDIPLATAKSRYYRGIAWLQLRLGGVEEESR